MVRILVVTAVAAERDAVVSSVTAATGAAPEVVALPGAWELHRVVAAGPVSSFDVLAAGVGPAAAAAGTATALAVAPVRRGPLATPSGELHAEPPDVPHASGEPSGGKPLVPHVSGVMAPGAVPGVRGEVTGPVGAAGVAYDLVVSAGIGGGFFGVAALEGVVVASSIVAADLGVRTADGFTDLAALGFGRVVHEPPAALVRAAADAAGAVLGPVLTVATVTGTAERAAELAALHPGAAAEGMEGFGVAEAAAAHGVPVLEVRAISNPVGPRDRAAWRIPAALRALSGAFARIEPVLRSASGGTDHGTAPD